MNNSFNRKELKNISRKFRGCCSRVLNSDFNDFDNNLKRFVLLLEEEKIIQDFINSKCIDKEYNIQEEVDNVSNSYGQYIFDSYLNEDDEIAYTYKILKYITENNVCFRSYAMGYTLSKKYQDMVKGFAERVLLPFINYVDEYLERIFIEMGLDENNTYNITINGNQINISKDKSILNATQTNNDISKLITELKDILNENDIDESIKNEIIENAEGIQEELMTTNPRKGRLKSFLSGLKNNVKLLPDSIEVSANIATIINFVTPFIQ